MSQPELLFLPSFPLKDFPSNPVWYVETTPNNFEPFTTKHGRIIQKAFELQKAFVRISKVVDGANEQCDIFFKKMVQRDVNGGLERKIKQVYEWELPASYSIHMEPLTEQEASGVHVFKVSPPSPPLTSTSDCAVCFERFSEDEPAVCLEQCTPNHGFHNECLQMSLNSKPMCPLCRAIIPNLPRVGPCPDGVMKVSFEKSSLPSFDGYPTIKLEFDFRGGIQDRRHPNPGVPYPRDWRVHYMPATEVGRRVLYLFILAWKQRLLFQIGTSLTRQQPNLIIYGSIHMKSHRSAYPFGWPDLTYFHRVTQEFSDAGVVIPEHREFLDKYPM